MLERKRSWGGVVKVDVWPLYTGLLFLADRDVLFVPKHCSIESQRGKRVMITDDLVGLERIH